MKLLKCYIENFGTLQNFSYDFKDGLNTILEDNGFGKTTFATFIRSMFYGLDASKKEDTDRKTYMPWQGGNFGGNIEFEVNGKQYRIERSFGVKAADDSFKLYNLETGLESTDYTENIGEEIFKINKVGYDRSTYIPQGKIQIEMEDSLNAKLGNVLESEGDINCSDEAIKKLEENIKVYVKTGNKGELNEKKKQLENLKRELEKTSSDEGTLNNYRKLLEEKNLGLKEKEELKKQKQDVLSKSIEQGRKQAKKEMYTKIENSLNENAKQYNDLQSFFKAGVPTDEKLDELKEKCIKVESLKTEENSKGFSAEESNRLNILREEFEGQNITQEIIDEKIQQCSSLQENKEKVQEKKDERDKLKLQIEEIKKGKSQKSKIFIGIIAICVIIAIAGVICNLIPLTVVGIIGVIAGVILKLTTQKSEQLKEFETQLESKENEIIVLEAEEGKTEADINKFLGEEIRDTDRIVKLMKLKTDFTSYENLKEVKLKKELELKNIRATKRSVRNRNRSVFTSIL